VALSGCGIFNDTGFSRTNAFGSAGGSLDEAAFPYYRLNIQKFFSYKEQMISDYDLFCRIVSTGSLSAAGREMHLSPAMVSKRLSRLETRLGARLIHRSTRKLIATEVGQSFYEDAAAILTQIASAEARVSGRADKPSGRLRIAAPTSFGRLHIAPHLAGFLKAYPRIALELLLDDIFVDLIDQRIDVAIRISLPPDAAYDAQLLAPNHRILCAAPSYIAGFGKPARIEDLARHHLLAADNQSPWRLEGPQGQKSIEIKSRVVTNSSDVVREAAVAGIGIALRSTWDISEEIHSGKLVPILSKWRGASDVGIYAIRPRTALMPVNVKVFIDYLGNLYGPSPPWE
jgi:DNA-binding transcriptional LysR family regulator